jgi:hypothetical protein
MKTSGKPFPSKYDSGRCPICMRRIVKGQLIVRLETTISWVAEKLSKHNKAYLTRCHADYVHEECLEENSNAH